MDETKEIQKDSAQESEKASEQTSGDSKGTTPEAKVKTYTDADIQKAVNDALSAKGRDVKRLSDWEESLKAKGEAIRSAEIRARQKELEFAGDDEELRRRIISKHELEDKQRKFEEDQKREKAGLFSAWERVTDLIKVHQLDFNDGIELLTNVLTAENPREVELLAENKALKRTKPQDKVREKEPEGFVPDSGKSEGEADDFGKLQQNFINDPQKYALAYKKALAKRGR